jgi:hypothetical protein
MNAFLGIRWALRFRVRAEKTSELKPHREAEVEPLIHANATEVLYADCCNIAWNCILRLDFAANAGLAQKN